MKRIEILYEDDSCLVLNKPAGLAVQGGSGIGVSLDSILAETYSPRPLLVHRLDRDTSGILLAARNREAAARFSRLLGSGRSAAGTVKQGTGRMHQIRRHLAMTGNPVPGDDKYGDFALNKKLRKTMGLKRLLLHASRLVIPSGAGAVPLDISAPPPDYFSAFARSFTAAACPRDAAGL